MRNAHFSITFIKPLTAPGHLFRFIGLKLILICHLAGFSDFSCQAQTAAERMKQVENGLMPWIQFQDSTPKRFSIRERMEAYQVPAVSIAVINNGQVEWAQAYGLADVAENRKATTNTIFQAASISKSVNALAVMKLVEEGKLSLDTDIRHYLKSWSFPDNEFSRNQPVTLAHLLSHTAGLNVHGFDGYAYGDSLPTLNQILNGQRPANSPAVKPVNKPGIKYQYSGGGTVITRKILEDNISGDYAALLAEKVLKPLQMNHSSFAQPLSGQQASMAATGYHEGGQAYKGKYHIYPELAPDGLWTTPTDLARFIIAVQQSLKGGPGNFLKPETTRKMLTPYLDSSKVALGFFLSNGETEPFFAHNGSNAGFNCDYFGSLHTGKGAVVMVNSDSYEIIYEIINGIASVYNWKGFYKPVVKKLASIPEDVLERYAGEYRFDENSGVLIRRVGHHLEIKGKADPHWETLYPVSGHEFHLFSNRLSYQFVSETGSDKPETLVLTNGRRSKKARKVE
ncbi:serine hydrolase domain-containing protein [Dyadobacter sp. 676]|uniref:Serine hydrolase domain-containing protein n=1 Tax=Dyadobacter sp. 676 TaxID=3088362 RepID=A0AAU8FET6_9BACT